MSDRKDLTRWNRAGLSRFRYVDGNAASYLETLRLSLLELFTDPVTREPRWRELDVSILPGESETDRMERLVTQYQGGRRDYGWEIARTLARSVHVLTGHLDAYANEGYLGTATQWDNLRRLVEMLDYHPAPPASAATVISLKAKAGRKGTVAAGFQIKNAPEDGSAPAIFETLKDLSIDSQLNELRVKDWNQSRELFDYTPCGGSGYCAEFPFRIPEEGVSRGSRGVLQIAPPGGDPVGIPVTVTGVRPDGLSLSGPAPPNGLNFPVLRHGVSLFLHPARIQKPSLIGDDTIRLDRDHNLSVGTAVAWQEGNSWYAARVGATEDRRLSLFGGEAGHGLPPEKKSIFRLHSAEAQTLERRRVLLIPPARDRGAGNAVWGPDLKRIPADEIESVEDPQKTKIYDEVTTPGTGKVFYLSRDSAASGAVRQRNLQALQFSGDPGDLASGRWLLLVDENDRQYARRIDSLEKGEGVFTLTLKGEPLEGTLKLLYGEFTDPVQPAGWNRNMTALAGSTLELDAERLPEAMEKGRRLILKADGRALAVTVTAVDTDARTVTVTPPVSGGNGFAFTRYGTVVLGNVVDAGHGESRPEAVLGSGDAARQNQDFVFKTRDIAFVSDATQASGVRAAVDVLVNGRKWAQVATLNDSGPTDPHYTIRMTEEGYLRVGFGDGARGRRLPTGRNNVRISCRVGTGPAGNLAAGSLLKPVKPHPLVDGVSQPLAATGGNAMEAVESIRQNAPASVLTLERAVSLADFTHLAGGHSSVWQARAVARPTGFSRHETVRVVVVPAGGGALGGLKDELEDYLEAHALPGVAVEVAAYEPVRLVLQVTVRIQTDAFEPDQVVRKVRQALLDAFCLERTLLGGVLYRSAVVRVVEGVEGVENSHCVIREATLVDDAGAPIPVRWVARGADGTIRSIRPTEMQVIHLDGRAPALEVSAEAFGL
ncbi:MAG: hypothetical protein ACOWWM_13525 [Desulfobacterales bacterium]